jgi:hypothetical protein
MAPSSSHGPRGRGLYLAEVRPRAKADVIVDNRSFAHPVVIGPAAGR